MALLCMLTIPHEQRVVLVYDEAEDNNPWLQEAVSIPAAALPVVIAWLTTANQSFQNKDSVPPPPEVTFPLPNKEKA